jgi:hypothetical protein
MINGCYTYYLTTNPPRAQGFGAGFGAGFGGSARFGVRFGAPLKFHERACFLPGVRV